MLAQPGRFAEFTGEPPDTRLCGDTAEPRCRRAATRAPPPCLRCWRPCTRCSTSWTPYWPRTTSSPHPPRPLLLEAADQTHPDLIDGVKTGPRGHAVFTAFANAAGLPAMALPCGQVGGLPAGLQLVGRAGADAALLAAALRYESQHPWADAWPAPPEV